MSSIFSFDTTIEVQFWVEIKGNGVNSAGETCGRQTKEGKIALGRRRTEKFI
jgi:hypothetical protein